MLDSSRRQYTLPLLVYALVSIFILWNLLLPGYVLTLDLVFGPRFNAVERLFFDYDAFIPVSIFLEVVSTVVPAWLIEKLLLFAALTISGISAYRLCPSQAGLGRYYGGLLYMMNPFVYVRLMAGQLSHVFGYALMPFAVLLFLKLLDRKDLKSSLRLALLLTLMAAFSTHTVLMTFMFFTLLTLVAIIFHRKDWSRIIVTIAGLAGGFLILNAYWLLPIPILGTSQTSLLSEVTSTELFIFTAQNWGTGPNILFSLATMHGFWRGGYVYITQLLPFWQLFYIAILFLVVYGVTAKINDRILRVPVITLTIAAVLALLFASGVSTPFLSDGFKSLYQQVPIMRAFRDSQKFVALLVLAYAFLGSLGAGELLREFRVRSRARKSEKAISVVVLLLIVSVPLIYSSNMLFGFGGRLKTADYPPDWDDINEYLKSRDGDFRVLFFPWHQYMHYSFAGTVIGNPSTLFFNVPVVYSQNIEIGDIYSQSPKIEQKYIEFLLSNRATIQNFGEMVVPLNIKYVILAKEADYKSYLFLENQTDLKLVKETQHLYLFENTHQTYRFYFVDQANSTNDWGSLLQESKRSNITQKLYLIDKDNSTRTTSTAMPKMRPLSFTRFSNTDFLVRDIKGEEGYLVFTEPFDDGWSMSNSTALLGYGVDNAFHLNGNQDSTSIHYSKADLLTIFYFVSSVGLAMTILCLTTRPKVRGLR